MGVRVSRVWRFFFGFQGARMTHQVDALEVLPKRKRVSREGAICTSDSRSCCCMASSTPRPPVYSSRCLKTWFMLGVAACSALGLNQPMICTCTNAVQPYSCRELTVLHPSEIMVCYHAAPIMTHLTLHNKMC